METSLKRLVIKIGTSSLTYKNGKINISSFEALLCFFFRVHINVNLIVSLTLKRLLVEKKAQKFIVEQFIVQEQARFSVDPSLISSTIFWNFLSRRN